MATRAIVVRIFRPLTVAVLVLAGCALEIQNPNAPNIDQVLLTDFKRVMGKPALLFRMATASLAQPEGRVKEVIYPVAGGGRQGCAAPGR